MKSFAFLVLILFAIPAGAQRDVIEVTVDKTSSSRSRTAAKKQIFEEAIEEVSMKYIEEIIGEKKVKDNLDLIKNNIIQSSKKYIPFFKGQDFIIDDKGSRMTVVMKLSIKDLESLLLNEGLLYKVDGPPKVLPMVSFVDRVDSHSFSWWAQQSSEDVRWVVEQTQAFHKELRKNLRTKGFYGVRPVFGSLRAAIPDVFQMSHPPTEDYLFIAHFFKSPIVLKGQFIVSPNPDLPQVYRIDVKVVAHHSGNGRVIGEVIRRYDTDAGPKVTVVTRKLQSAHQQITKDLAVQVHDAWKSGTFGANLLKVAIKGELDYQKLAQFKKLLLNQVKEMKTLKERLFEPGRVLFEADASTGAQSLAKNIETQEFPRFKVEVDDIEAGSIELTVSAK